MGINILNAQIHQKHFLIYWYDIFNSCRFCTEPILIIHNFKFTHLNNEVCMNWLAKLTNNGADRSEAKTMNTQKRYITNGIEHEKV